MDQGYIKLSIAALMPVALSVIFYLLDKKTSFGRINKTRRQVWIGIAYGILAIVGTEWGIPMNGAQVNCRDAAVLTAGLMFGGPAGIIAGLIGGVERWVAVYWGVGSFTRVACSVSTIIAGIYAALLRRFMFEGKKPYGALMPLCIGVVMEVFHLSMVFFTNMSDTAKAMAVVQACSVPMITANGISVMLSGLLMTILYKENLVGKSRANARISQTVQRYLLITVVAAFLATSVFVWELQTSMAREDTSSLLSLSLDEVALDVLETSDRNLLAQTKRIASQSVIQDLMIVAEENEVAEISKIDRKGIIFESTTEDYVGFDMKSGEQSSAFMVLLDGADSFVQEYGPISSDNSVYRKYAGVPTRYGFIQVGLDGDQFQKQIAEEVVYLTKNRHVGQNGFIMVVDGDYDLVSAPEGFDMNSVEWGTDTAPAEGEVFQLTIADEVYFGCMRNTEGYYIVAVQPRQEAMNGRTLAMYVNSYMEILVFALLFGLIYLLIKKVVVDRIKRVNESLDRITDGDLNEVVNVRENEEFASLSDDINSTVDTLKRFIDEASARIDADLQMAKNIQASALPNVFPAFPKRKDFDIFASMNPAKEVGGDFYDFYMTGSDTLNFLIADVSGKGIPAAMFMMRAKTELKSLTEAGMAVDESFTRGKAALCEGNDAGMFVTAWQGGIDLETGLVRFANAGHNPPVVRHKDGQFEYLRSKVGFVLAGMDGVKYKPQELQLEPGDILYLYTDGVTEATDANTELYGEDRLLKALNSKEFENMEDLCHHVKADVDAFVGEAPQFDDITMVALHYKGAPPVPTFHVDECKIEDIPVLTEFVEAELEKLDAPMKTTIQMSVAIDEIYSNIVYYGYKTEKPGPVTVKVIYKEEKNAVYLRFADEGIPYNPLVKEDPDVTLSAEERGVGGLGIFMVKKTMDSVKYKYENGQNILTIKKFL